MDPFLTFTSKLTNPRVDVGSKAQYICQFTAQQISGADRVSMWRFNEDNTKITCTICYDVNSKAFSSGQEISKAQFERYIDEILQTEVINAPIAREHPVTKCFTESYFKPLEIYSLLDFVLHQDFSPVGVICCESVGRKVNWTEQNVELLKRVARASSLYFNVD